MISTRLLLPVRSSCCIIHHLQHGLNYVSDGSTSVHRADMLNVLTDSLSEVVSTHFMKRLVGYVEGGSGVITMSFADGTTAETDVLVGADGLKSVTRAIMYQTLSEAAKVHDEVEAEKLQDFIQPTWTGMYAYRALVDSEKLLKIAPEHESPKKPIMVSISAFFIWNVFFLMSNCQHFGRSRHIVAYPISKGRFVNFVSLNSHPEKEGTRVDGAMVKEVPIDELRLRHEGWEPHVQQLLGVSLFLLSTFLHNLTTI